MDNQSTPALPHEQVTQWTPSNPLSTPRVTEISAALGRLDAWIESESFQGWDPYDALNSPLLRVAANRNRVLGAAIVQSIRRSPLNIRPLLAIRKGYNPKAMGLFLATYAQKFLATRQDGYLERVRFFYDWLRENASPGYAGYCWGYNFDWPNRAFFAPAGTPTIVNTAFIGLCLLSADPVLRASAAKAGAADQVNPCLDGKDLGRTCHSLQIARNACNFILDNLQTLRPSDEETCFSYTPLDRRFVHNANLLGAWLLAAVYARTGEEHLARNARAAARFTARRQRPDGSWVYGPARNDQWVDNFHTGYVLVTLKSISALLRTHEFDSTVQTGYWFWKTRMFESTCIPKYFPHKTYPIDIHSVAQAILTFLHFSDVDPEAAEHGGKVALWAIRNMQDREGFFYYQRHRTFTTRIPYIRWAQAWMQQALTRLTVPASVSGYELVPPTTLLVQQATSRTATDQTPCVSPNSTN